ncbi:MAG: aminoacyl-tRNA hydrolase [Firmicutes bacterium GWF2_51_9]|nr:MAG: aminoacyl-tRNA hydrolase [Firmicutes bacterium GWF2_51_9]OGS57337.1 MAG: aminoacyl-tRNA hydrolase [Firmicutes bacterium GWE2_51_13]HAM62528.1 aminoacyl-tRNA hydrolase [Erysipelotrichaceae bacterium]HBZ41449.1 aminoacyl-tRNA hydrolase [Erysipelotrichaceae bacterium]
MKMIVGLGNPGKTYEQSRHNTGFRVLEEVLRKVGNPSLVRKFKAKVATVTIGDEQVLLMKPETYMNLSGEAVVEAARFYKIEPKDILVVYDDLDLPVGKVRLREKGSAGGQNGMKNIILHLHTQEFPRIRVGIDKNPMIPTVDYVLGKIEKEKRELHQKSIEHAADAAIAFAKQPFLDVMNQFNKKVD